MMFKAFFRKYALWIGFMAVLGPLVLLLSLQYSWLATLEKTTAIAERSALNNYLEAVSNNVSHFYTNLAERTLNIPADLFRDAELQKVHPYLEHKKVDGVRYLFVTSFTKHSWDKLVVYDPINREFSPKLDVTTTRAINFALAPWRTLAWEGVWLKSTEISVDEGYPEHRIILNPITSAHGELVGVTGMMLSNSFFRDKMLPAAINKSIPGYGKSEAAVALMVTVLDGRDQLVYGDGLDDEATEQVSITMPFVFTDHQLFLGGRYVTPEQFAKSNFTWNLSLAVLLTIVLLGGIVLALRTASREVRLSRMKSDFVSNVSHELRTPLASIRVFGEFFRLGRVKDEEKSKEYGAYIETETRRLTALINNILDFAKIESGGKTYLFAMTDITAVLEDVLGTLKVSLRHKGFDLRLTVEDVCQAELEIDPDAIMQALSNLVDNAVKFSDGDRRIEVSLQGDEHWVRIAVKDHGVGISRGQQKKIFERFHRVSAGLVHDVKGSGLGLSIVHHIAEAHGGKITVESEPGRGSTFVLHFPCNGDPETGRVDITTAGV
jgi:signal transduction histidine kinase